MTLLINEIHVWSNQQSLILCVADRRITVGGKFHSNRRKLFKIPHLKAGVGYFGLSQVNQKEFFSGWLPNFISNTSDTTSLEQFAHRLCDKLNQDVDKSALKSVPSGFHICGYNVEGHPELWFVRNIGAMEGPYYKDFTTKYSISEDFLSRDARRKLGYDGSSFCIPTGHIGRQYYINGDVRPFYAIWLKLDDSIKEMRAYPKDFPTPKSESDDLVQIAKWKMNAIASFYKWFAHQKIIGPPIDAFVLLP